MLCVAGQLVAQPAHRERDLISLPDPDTAGNVPLERALGERRSIRRYAPGALSVKEVSQLLWAAQGETQPRTGYRTAPSAGATYPLEVYLVAGRIDGLSAGLYRYLPRRHELTKIGPDDLRDPLHRAALGQRMVLDAPVVLVIAGVTERTAGRYGARAARYVAMEAGHASQNIYLQATVLGLGTVAVGAFDDRAVARTLGLPDGEEPLYLMPVGRQ